MNKKGFLLGEETIKIVIAVICIGFLIYLLVAVYFSLTDQQKTKEATEIINGDHGIAKEISRINSGGNVSDQGFLVPNPADWYIFSFTGDNKKPNLCSGNNCLCICGNVLLDFFDAQVKSCDNTGVCTVVTNLKSFDKIKINSNGVVISITKIGNEIEVKQK